jgi:predicted house-cleaning noncanonical NTP pyrophosphatase (MazG superfamily)
MNDNTENKSKTAGQLLREDFWENKKKRKFSPEIKEILEKNKEEILKKKVEIIKKVARAHSPEAGV